MTGLPTYEHEVGVFQAVLDGRRLSATLRTLGPIEPALADVLNGLHLRIYPRDRAAGDRSDNVVLDLRGVSIGVQRRRDDLYLHADVSETKDALIAFEVNGGGETDQPTH